MSNQITSIAVSALHPFAGNPFESSTADVAALAASIRDTGIIEPLIVRPKAGRYEIIAGHRRWAAATQLGMETVPCLVSSCSDEEAVIRLITSNMTQRTSIPAGEYAVAVKMMMDACRHQGSSQSDATAGERANVWVAQQLDVSVAHIKANVRAAELDPALLHQYAIGRMPLSAASTLHDLAPEWQRQVAECLTDRPTKLTYAVARQLVIAQNNGQLTRESLEALLYPPAPQPEEKKSDKAIRLSFAPEALRPFVDINATPDDIQREILRLLKKALPDAALSNK